MMQEVLNEEALVPWEVKNDTFWFKSKIYLPPQSPPMTSIIAMIHEGCHEGYRRTLHRVSYDFYWPGMKHQVQTIVSNCSTCQRNKKKSSETRGTLATPAYNLPHLGRYFHGFHRSITCLTGKDCDFRSNTLIL